MKPTAVITGASGGIGAKTALCFAKNGYNVVLNYNNSKDSAENTCAEINRLGGNAITVKADVKLMPEIEKMFSEAEKEFGRIDVLINNAGIARQQVLSDITDNDWNEIFDVNAAGTFRCCKAVLPYMLKNHSGSIVNISSMWGICGSSCESAYSASKAAVIGFTKSLAKELGLSGIRVNCVAPGVIDTAMNRNYSGETMNELAEAAPLCRIGAPEEIAESIYFLASEKAGFITGQVLSPNGGFVI